MGRLIVYCEVFVLNPDLLPFEKAYPRYQNALSFENAILPSPKLLKSDSLHMLQIRASRLCMNSRLLMPEDQK